MTKCYLCVNKGRKATHLGGQGVVAAKLLKFSQVRFHCKKIVTVNHRVFLATSSCLRYQTSVGVSFSMGKQWCSKVYSRCKRRLFTEDMMRVRCCVG